MQDKKFKPLFPDGYKYAPNYSRKKLADYASEAPRIPGFARNYGSRDHHEDTATIAEHIFHGTIPEREINAEYSLILKVKIEALKELLAEKIGYTKQHKISGEFYWSLISTSSFVDKMFGEGKNKEESNKLIEEEFERWKTWWSFFEKK